MEDITHPKLEFLRIISKHNFLLLFTLDSDFDQTIIF